MNLIILVWLALLPIPASYYLYSAGESERLARMELQSQGSQFLSYVDNRAGRIQYLISDAFAQLSHSSLLFDFAQTRSPQLKRYLHDQWYLASQNYSYFSQLRYIDSEGMEIVRVDLNDDGSKPKLVADAKLQDKSHRDYFHFAKTLKSGQVGHFGIDLEYENGQVVQPYKPSLRLLFPLNDGETSLGYFIANLDVHKIIREITENEMQYQVHFIDSDGEYVLSSDLDKTFARVLGRADYQNLSQQQPHLWQEIEKSKPHEGTVIDDNGMYVFRSMVPSVWVKMADMVLLTQFPRSLVDAKCAEYHRYSLAVTASIVLLILILAVIIVVLGRKYRNNKLKQLFYNLVIERGSAVVLTDMSHTILQTNAQFQALLGYRHSQLINVALTQFHVQQQLPSELEQKLGKNGLWKGTLELVGADDGHHVCEVEVRIIDDEYGEPNYYVYSMVDISKHYQRLSELKERSEKDLATKLWNKSKFEEMLKMQCDLVGRYLDHPSGCLVLVDVDCFKQINDSFGHLVGDEVLIHVSKQLTNELRQTDVIGRIGGDEFAAILQHTDEQSAKALLERVKASIAGWCNFPVSVSIGVAPIEANMTQSFANADAALYHAKRNGRNAVVSHSELPQSAIFSLPAE